MKRTVSLWLSAVLAAILLTGPFTASAAAAPALTVSKVAAFPGETVSVTVGITGNPGLTAAVIRIGYGSGLTLTKVKNSGLMGTDVTAGKLTQNPYYYSWYNPTRTANITKNGTLLTLSFRVAADAAGPLTVTAVCESACNAKLKAVTLAKGTGTVTLPKPALTELRNTAAGLKLTWKKVAGSTGYRVFRKTAKSGWKQIKALTGTAFTDTAPVTGTRYTYTVAAVKNTLLSPKNQTGLSLYRVGVPASVTVAPAKKGQLRVAWKKLAGCTGYRVKNVTTGKTVTVTGLSRTFTGLKAGKAYRFRVRAYKTAGGKTTYGAWSAVKQAAAR